MQRHRAGTEPPLLCWATKCSGTFKQLSDQVGATTGADRADAVRLLALPWHPD